MSKGFCIYYSVPGIVGIVADNQEQQHPKWIYVIKWLLFIHLYLATISSQWWLQAQVYYYIDWKLSQIPSVNTPANSDH